jgi:hypothetical protein
MTDSERGVTTDSPLPSLLVFLHLLRDLRGELLYGGMDPVSMERQSNDEVGFALAGRA